MIQNDYLYSLDEMKHELQDIISGKGQVRDGAAIQAVACYLKRSQSAGTMAKGAKRYKEQETEILLMERFENRMRYSKMNDPEILRMK
jgi:hypothetical protein